MKKMIAFILAVTVLLGSLAGCGAADVRENADAEISASPVQMAEETPEETAAADPPEPAEPVESEEPEAAVEPDFELAFAKYAPDTEVMTIDGVEINWQKYYDALYQYAQSLYLYYGLNDFTMELSDGYNVGDWLREMTETELRRRALFYAKAAELGLELTDDDEARIDEEIQSYADANYGGDIDAMFADAGVSAEYYRFQAGAAILYDKLFAWYFGADGSAISDADAIAYAEDNGYLYAKHILFKTIDDAGDPLDDETIAEKKAAAMETMERLRAADPSVRESLFDALMTELSEDGGLAYYPDGYFFQEGDMITEFYEAALALEEGQISDIVEGPYGYHILYRPAIRPDAVFNVDSDGSPYTLRHVVASALFENMLDEWYDAAEITWAGDFADLDAAALFTAP